MSVELNDGWDEMCSPWCIEHKTTSTREQYPLQ